MTISTLEPRNHQTQLSICPHCGRSVDLPTLLSHIETGLGVLAGLVLALMLAPLGIVA